MKFLIIFFLAAIAMSSAEECGEEKVEACIQQIMGALMSDKDEDEICKDVDDAIKCLRHVVNECEGGNPDEDVEEALQFLEKVVGEACAEGGDADDEEVGKCFEEHADYIFECLVDAPEKAIPVMIESGITDKNSLTCATYAMIAGCFLDRVEESCGAEAAEELGKELEDIPESITKACADAAETEFTDLDLLDRKRK